MPLFRLIPRLALPLGMFTSRQSCLPTASARLSGSGGNDLETKARSNPRLMTRDEWREILNPSTFEVARDRGTERPFTSPLYENHEKGKYRCACCSAELFSSDHKFDSGTGWPSFFDTASSESVSRHTDKSLGMIRVEVLCRNCDAHLGHVFNDGPPPTRLRYCINGITLKFEATPATD